jgi:transaldolase
MNRIHELRQVGQSIWLDFIERSKMNELQELIDAGLGGVTSNPTIFQQAISSSEAYQNDLANLAKKESDPKVIFEALAVTDIQTAADMLLPVYSKSNGYDGYVSIEVAPDLADDTAATIAEAHKLHQAVDRPNVMIKVPATQAGIAAIRQLIADGINVNVTLIFGLERYAAVKNAYLQGLEERLSHNKPVDKIASVASFFVSRVDSLVDKQLEQLAKGSTQPERATSLMGQAAVANAKLAYQQFQQLFSGPRWEKLAQAGAQLQRPLWASTSTKNPEYPELLYVENLIGPHTVNTMPPKTLQTFRDQGTSARTVDQDVDKAAKVIEDLEELGISMKDVSVALEKEGVEKFADSYKDLLETIAKQRQEAVAS